jgi:hypothetical protein
MGRVRLTALSETTPHLGDARGAAAAAKRVWELEMPPGPIACPPKW